jgi:SAM-dependent methyltransferase
MSKVAGLFTDGEAYERLMGRWSMLAGAVFLEWLDPPERLRWIDVGCGNGAFTEQIINRAGPAAVTGVDPSAGQIAYARKRPRTGMAEFDVGDAQALAFADDSFDAATMALVISFVPDPAKAVAEMARVVRPGGWVAAYMWDFHGGGAPFAPASAVLKSLGMTPPGPPSADASRLDAMRDLWGAAGLQSIDTRAIRISVAWTDFDDLWTSHNLPVGPMGQFIDALPADTKERLRTLLREQLPAGADGRIFYEAVANAVKGRVPA